MGSTALLNWATSPNGRDLSTENRQSMKNSNSKI